jgi:hypothetical protein
MKIYADAGLPLWNFPRTYVFTFCAAETLIWIDDDRAILVFMVGGKWADGRAGGIFTVHAAPRDEDCLLAASHCNFCFMHIDEIIRSQPICYILLFGPVFDGFSWPGLGNTINNLGDFIFVNPPASTDTGRCFTINASVTKAQIDERR